MFVRRLPSLYCRLSSLAHTVAKRQEANAAAQRMKLEIVRQRVIRYRLMLLLREQVAALDRLDAEARRRDASAASAGADSVLGSGPEKRA